MTCLDRAAWVEAIGTWAGALASLITAAVALFQEQIRRRLFGPRLRLDVVRKGDRTRTTVTGREHIWWSILVSNESERRPAEHVRVMLEGLQKKRPDGTYSEQLLGTPLQLYWAYRDFVPQFPTIGKPEHCNLGWLDRIEGRFALSTYIVPNNFQGYVEAGETLLVHVAAWADNFQPKAALYVEISWDGEWWPKGEDETQQHLLLRVLEGGQEPVAPDATLATRDAGAPSSVASDEQLTQELVGAFSHQAEHAQKQRKELADRSGAADEAQQARVRNIIDMATRFAAMDMVFAAGSVPLIRSTLYDRLGEFLSVGAEEDYLALHEHFCAWFTSTITQSRSSELASWGQAAKMLDVVLKVCVHYCSLPDPHASSVIVGWLNAPLDNAIIQHLGTRHDLPWVSSSASLADIDRQKYQTLQAFVRREIARDCEGKILPVQYDDIRWRELNR